MSKSSFNGIMAIVVFILAAITLGGLGNAAFAVDKFYWVPFVINVGVYGVWFYKTIRKSLDANVEEAKEAGAEAKARDPKTGRYVKAETK